MCRCAAAGGKDSDWSRVPCYHVRLVLQSSPIHGISGRTSRTKQPYLAFPPDAGNMYLTSREEQKTAMDMRLIDVEFFEPNVIGTFLIETGDGPVLIETGPATTFEALKRGIEGAGYAVEDIRHVLVTHIHLDHAGASWLLASHGATIYVHPRGAKHLVDPTRLLASALRIYGDDMDRLWGRVEPIDEERVRPCSDGERLRFGRIEITVVETLGHASHHNAYVIDGVVVMGDVGGIRIKSGPPVPPTPPPDINVELWRQSLDRLRALRPSMIYPTHFGGYTDVKDHLDELEEMLVMLTEWVGARMKEGLEEEEIVKRYDSLLREELKKRGAAEDVIPLYELGDPFWMNVSGLVRYWNKLRSL